MTTKTIRTIAELNMQPLVRVSRMSVMAYVCLALFVVFMDSNICFAFLLVSALMFNEHVLWCDARHKRKEMEDEGQD